MAASAGTVTLELDANSVRLLRELQKSQRATKRAATGMQKSMSGAFKSIANSAKGLGAAFSVAFAARTIKGIADAGIAMEQMRRGMEFATGSVEAAGLEMEFVRDTAFRLGISLEESGRQFAKLAAAAKGTSLEGQAVRDIFTGVASASRVMGLSADQTTGALRAIEQMISKGNVQAEELRGQLGERLPGAFAMAARAMGKTTVELNKLLETGKVTAEEMLPALSREMEKVYGPSVAEAAGSAQAQIQNFQNAIFELKASIAESGLLELLAKLATGMRMVIAPTEQEMLGDLARQIEAAQAAWNEAGGMGVSPQVKELRIEYMNLLKAMSDAQNKADEARFIEGLFVNVDAAVGGAVNKLALFNKQMDQASAAKDKFNNAWNVKQRLSTAVQSIEATSDALDEFFEGQDKAEEERTRKAEARADASVKQYYKELEEARKTFGKMTVYADQAARNMQDAFAEFLFDPFEDGLKGMVRGFIDALRQMLANQMASQVFSLMGSLFKGNSNPNDPGGFIGAGLSALFPPGRAAGGPVAAGMPYTVGERGMEMFIPSESGTIVPHHELGGGNSVVNNYHFEAGADIATIRAEIIPMLERTKDVTKAEIMQMRAEGRG